MVVGLFPLLLLLVALIFPHVISKTLPETAQTLQRFPLNPFSFLFLSKNFLL